MTNMDVCRANCNIKKINKNEHIIQAKICTALVAKAKRESPQKIIITALSLRSRHI